MWFDFQLPPFSCKYLDFRCKILYVPHFLGRLFIDRLAPLSTVKNGAATNTGEQVLYADLVHRLGIVRLY